MKANFNNITTKEFLIEKKLPIQTSSYKPVSNKMIIENTLEGIERTGFTLKNEVYYSAKNGNQCLGRYGIQLDDTKIGIEIAFHNSYDKSLSLKYASGSQVFICKNGCVMGSDGAFKSKHVGEIQTVTPKMIEEFLNKSSDRYFTILKQKQRFQEIEITKRTTAELLGRLFAEEECINTTQLGIIKREIDNPSFNYDVENTVWNFWNHCTYAMQETHPKDYINKSLKLYNFFEEVYA